MNDDLKITKSQLISDAKSGDLDTLHAMAEHPLRPMAALANVGMAWTTLHMLIEDSGFITENEKDAEERSRAEAVVTQMAEARDKAHGLIVYLAEVIEPLINEFHEKIAGSVRIIPINIPLSDLARILGEAADEDPPAEPPMPPHGGLLN